MLALGNPLRRGLKFRCWQSLQGFRKKQKCRARPEAFCLSFFYILLEALCTVKTDRRGPGVPSAPGALELAEGRRGTQQSSPGRHLKFTNP